MNNGHLSSDSSMREGSKSRSMQSVQNIAGINFSTFKFLLKIFKMMIKKIVFDKLIHLYKVWFFYKLSVVFEDEIGR